MIIIKPAENKNIPTESVTIGWKLLNEEGKEYGDFMYIPLELLKELKEKL